MKELEILLENYWIIRDRNKELYYKIKDGISKLKPFIEDKLGYRIVLNPAFIKLEKLPGKAEPWMGISSFGNILEYTFFCLLLVFLEDRDSGEQFVLSEITEMIQGKYPDLEKIDWTLYTHRRSLVKVLRFAVDLGLMFIDDGDEKSFIESWETEVLYQSSGLSRYFMRNFSGNILNYNSLEDIEKGEWLDLNPDRGRLRRNRVYRRLVLSPAVYSNDSEDEDYLYIKNYRSMIQNDLEVYLEMDLHVHKNGAFTILPPERHFKDTFPSNKTISDIGLLICSMLRKRLQTGEITRSENETIRVSKAWFESLVDRCRSSYMKGWSKVYREMSTGMLYREIIQFMKNFLMIEIDKSTEEIIIMPLAGKMIGKY